MPTNHTIPQAIWLALTIGAFAARTSLAQSEHELPNDLDQPVIELAYTGGAYARWKGDQPAVLVQVYADGKVIAGGYSPEFVQCQWTMNQRELKDLFEELSLGMNAFSIDGDRIRQQIGNQVENTVVSDAPNTLLRIRSVQKDHRIAIHATAYFARMFPDIAGLAEVVRIEARLRQLTAVAVLGGHEAIDQVLKEVATYLEKTDATLPKLAPQDVSSALKNAQGVLMVSLRKEIPAANDQPPKVLQVTYRRTASGTTISHVLLNAPPRFDSIQ